MTCSISAASDAEDQSIYLTGVSGHSLMDAANMLWVGPSFRRLVSSQ